MPQVSPIDLLNRVHAVVAALPDFAAGRVTKGDQSVLNDEDWRDDLPAAVVYIGTCVIGGRDLDALSGGIGARLSVFVRVSVPNKDSSDFGDRLTTLIENVYEALLPTVAFGTLSVQEKRLRMGEMPTYQVVDAPDGGIDQWFIVECVSL